MSLDSIRQDITTVVVAAAPSFTAWALNIEYDNRVLESRYEIVDPFLCVKVNLTGGYQADISDNPVHRIMGQILLGASVREGEGSAKANVLLSHFYERLQRKTLGSVRTYMAMMGGAHPDKNRVEYQVIVPFWCDKTY